MKWYEKLNPSDDVVISSRVRLARNLENYPFPTKLDPETSKKAAFAIRQAFDADFPEKLEFSEMNSNALKSCLLEEHMISPDFCAESDLYRALMTDSEGTLSIMINEEDHVRIQAIFPGLSLDEAYSRADGADDALNKGAKIAFDEKLGFLTSCPTNLGTGMRASVMLHLPAMSACGYIKSLVNLMTKVGLCVRGLYGEGSEAVGCMYQLSNQITLGISENETLEKLKSAVAQIADKERELRAKMFEKASDELSDDLWRSYGTLKYARRIDTAEAAKLISNLMLAASSGTISECRGINFAELLINIMPGHIEKIYENAKDTASRDKCRADFIRKTLEKNV